MPYKYLMDKKKIPRALDRRVKLTEDDKEHIRYLHKSGRSIHSIAREYAHKCTRRTIQYTIKPELYDHLRKAFIERRKDGKYKPTKEKWRAIMREHRQYKQKIKDKLI